ncbi:hypothetical protein BVRB_9g224620 [Beta vulgaris subsp. vulgaris]|uniref:Uncharacterized protein n=1 Tax=Beta vulgaris subsp. vulgaris TaxID=3555 RepID=A0A0J8B5F5_BETVV|nr:hypothetical protein BVRB_9g224620 [Beta vulgaris subsp. vulgaris]
MGLKINPLHRNRNAFDDNMDSDSDHGPSRNRRRGPRDKLNPYQRKMQKKRVEECRGVEGEDECGGGSESGMGGSGGMGGVGGSGGMEGVGGSGGVGDVGGSGGVGGVGGSGGMGGVGGSGGMGDVGGSGGVGESGGLGGSGGSGGSGGGSGGLGGGREGSGGSEGSGGREDGSGGSGGMGGGREGSGGSGVGSAAASSSLSRVIKLVSQRIKMLSDDGDCDGGPSTSREEVVMVKCGTLVATLEECKTVLGGTQCVHENVVVPVLEDRKWWCAAFSANSEEVWVIDAHRPNSLEHHAKAIEELAIGVDILFSSFEGQWVPGQITKWERKAVNMDDAHSECDESGIHMLLAIKGCAAHYKFEYLSPANIKEERKWLLTEDLLCEGNELKDKVKKMIGSKVWG